MVELVAQPRSEFGKEKCRQMRAENRLPGNLYGGGLPEPRAISLDLHETEKLIKAHGKSAEYTVSLDGKVYPVTIQEISYEPIYKGFQHVDFLVETDE